MNSPTPESSGDDWQYAGPNLRRRKTSGVYYVFAKHGGKQFRRSLDTADKATAKRKRDDFMRGVNHLRTGEDAQITFAELAALWIEAERHTLKESSARRRAAAVKAIAPAFSGLQIGHITARHCEEWAKARAAAASAATFCKELDTMRGAFGYAVAHGLILHDPSRNIKRPRIRNKRPSVPTREQFEAIIATVRADAQGKGNDGADMVQLLAFSGMRLNEARSLRWRDVNFTQGEFTVTGGETGTKNHETRTVPLSDDLRALLERIKHERGSVAPGDCILQTASAKKCLQTACRKLGLPPCHHHSMRHYFTTCSLEGGVDVHNVARWRGDKDGGSLLLKTYAHLRQSHSKEQMKLVNFHAPPTQGGAKGLLEHLQQQTVSFPKIERHPLPLGNPAAAPIAEGEDSGRAIKTPPVES